MNLALYFSDLPPPIQYLACRANQVSYRLLTDLRPKKKGKIHALIMDSWTFVR